jgi:hypothetical protein
MGTGLSCPVVVHRPQCGTTGSMGQLRGPSVSRGQHFSLLGLLFLVLYMLALKCLMSFGLGQNNNLA